MVRVPSTPAEDKPAGAPRSGWRSRGYLPHFDSEQVIQHIVFRLSDALPKAVLAHLDASPSQDRLRAAESALDAGLGSRALADPRVATVVEGALIHFDAERYDLMAWCVMPTHVHVLVAQMPAWPLASVTHAGKSFTANRANSVLGRRGRLRAPEYFDGVMRNERQIELTIAYIENNPVAAGLCATPDAWRWSSAGTHHKKTAGWKPALRPGCMRGAGARVSRPDHT